MKILFCSYAYPNAGQTQLATFNRTMLAGLARQHAVRVLAPIAFLQKWRHPPCPSGFQAVDGIIAEYPAYYYPPKVMRHRYDEFLWWSIKDQLLATIEEFQPDVLLSYWAHPDGAVAVRAGQEMRIPTVVMTGGSDVLVLGRSGRRRIAILKTLTRADRIIAVSEDIAATMLADGISAEKIAVVPRGIDSTRFCPGDRTAARTHLKLPQDETILVGAGRLVPVKDWRTVIDACQQLRRRGREVRCYLIGNGPLRDALQHQIHELQLEKFVHLVGTQNQEQLAQWYRAADLTVLSSTSEGIPNVLLECISCGGSFVATKVGGIPEIADLDYDRLVPPESPTVFGLAIADRLDHPPILGMGRRFVPNSLEDSTKKITEVLESAIEARARSEAKSTPIPVMALG